MKTRLVEILGGLALTVAACSGQGIITTVAGSYSGSKTSDGGLAVNTLIQGVGGIALDNQGNLYIWDGSSSKVKKVDTSGILTTIAGNGTAGYSGDGGRRSMPNYSLVQARFPAWRWIPRGTSTLATATTM